MDGCAADESVAAEARRPTLSGTQALNTAVGRLSTRQVNDLAGRVSFQGVGARESVRGDRGEAWDAAARLGEEFAPGTFKKFKRQKAKKDSPGGADNSKRQAECEQDMLEKGTKDERGELHKESGLGHGGDRLEAGDRVRTETKKKRRRELHKERDVGHGEALLRPEHGGHIRNDGGDLVDDGGGVPEAGDKAKTGKKKKKRRKQRQSAPEDS
jgi:hypothetical protein